MYELENKIEMVGKTVSVVTSFKLSMSMSETFGFLLEFKISYL